MQSQQENGIATAAQYIEQQNSQLISVLRVKESPVHIKHHVFMSR